MGILISQYKDPYKPTGIMESRRVFFVAHVVVKMKLSVGELEQVTRFCRIFWKGLWGKIFSGFP